MVPRNFSLFPVDIFYGVTTDGLCNSISATDCKSPAQITCLPNADCKIQLYNDITINDCAGRKADYISFEYRLLPRKITWKQNIKVFKFNLIQRFQPKMPRYATILF